VSARTAPISPHLDRLRADLERLATFREPDAPGWTRPVFSALDREARGWIADQMAAAGLKVQSDQAANVIGTRPGRRRERAAVVTGSHTDTVHGGGRFDGIIGVLGAIEVARCLNEAGTELEHDLVIVDFLGEEPNDFGLSCIGSRAIAGSLEPEHLELTNLAGEVLADALRLAGGDPGAVTGARWDPERVHAYVELHIEQGPLLEQAGATIGVVTGIAGIERLIVTFEGQSDHAGTTRMDLRRDALCGAAELVLAIERLARGEAGGALSAVRGAGSVATVGQLDVEPGALNVVPGAAHLRAEARSHDDAWLDEFAHRIDAETVAIAASRGLKTTLSWVTRQHAVPVTAWVSEVIWGAAAALGFDPLAVPSDAGHDACYAARLGPMGMIFVPSNGGRSHCPEEWTDLDQIGDGVAVLAETILRLDAAVEPAFSTA
jgi:N-carbamoyl-L-amino-acid hydrolase